jgi:hypothetical protein
MPVRYGLTPYKVFLADTTTTYLVINERRPFAQPQERTRDSVGQFEVHYLLMESGK